MPRFKQNISSNSLFHFVKKISYLSDILDNGLQARYCHEHILGAPLPFAYPMKCFCDIPLGNIKNHFGQYGSYGIGITKKFALLHGITPVIYVHKNSNTFLQLTSKTDVNSEISSILPYYKMYDESFYYTPNKHTNEFYVRYYDEREWRYIPPSSEAILLGTTSKSHITRKVNFANNNLKSNKYRLKVPYTSITFIFVKNEKDRKLLIEIIRHKYKSKNVQDLLISKILSTYRILKDF